MICRIEIRCCRRFGRLILHKFFLSAQNRETLTQPEWNAMMHSVIEDKKIAKFLPPYPTILCGIVRPRMTAAESPWTSTTISLVELKWPGAAESLGTSTTILLV